MTIDRERFEQRARVMPEHMNNLVKLVPGTLKGARFAVVTITDAVIVDARRGNNSRTGEPAYEPAVVLRYAEFPDRVHWLNKMGVNIVADVYGNEEQDWVGKQVPIVVKEDVLNPTTKKKEDMVWVANTDEWPKLFEEDVTAREKAASVKAPENAAARVAREAAEKRKLAARQSET